MKWIGTLTHKRVLSHSLTRTRLMIASAMAETECDCSNSLKQQSLDFNMYSNLGNKSFHIVAMFNAKLIKFKGPIILRL